VQAHYFNQGDFEASKQLALKGISAPRKVKLPAGHFYYRFVNEAHASKASQYVAGPWWFEFDQFHRIERFAKQHGYSLGYSARLHAAILYEWSEIKGLVRARLTQPVLAWKGSGKQIRTKVRDPRDQKTMTPMQSIHQVYQLCIPGLSDSGHPFSSIEVKKIDSKF
jgi:hypothetical protein